MESPIINNIIEESKVDSVETDHQIFNKTNMHRKTVSSSYKLKRNTSQNPPSIQPYLMPASSQPYFVRNNFIQSDKRLMKIYGLSNQKQKKS